jgi:hypothetical protein
MRHQLNRFSDVVYKNCSFRSKDVVETKVDLKGIIL